MRVSGGAAPKKGIGSFNYSDEKAKKDNSGPTRREHDHRKIIFKAVQADAYRPMGPVLKPRRRFQAMVIRYPRSDRPCSVVYKSALALMEVWVVLVMVAWWWLPIGSPPLPSPRSLKTSPKERSHKLMLGIKNNRKVCIWERK